MHNNKEHVINRGVSLTFDLFVAYIIEKLRECKFFDDEIKTSIFFLTIHDAMLCIHDSHPPITVSEKVKKS